MVAEKKFTALALPEVATILRGRSINLVPWSETPSGKWEGKETDLPILSYWMTLILTIALKAK